MTVRVALWPALFWLVALSVLVSGCSSDAEEPSDDPGDASSVDAPDGSAEATPPTVTISPSAPTSRDRLTATASGGVVTPASAPTYTFEWTRDGEPEVADGSGDPSDGEPGAAAGTTSWIDGSRTTRGEIWLVRARQVLDDGSAGPAGEAEVVIGDSAPRCAAAIFDPPQPVGGEAVVCLCDGRDDPDGDIPSDECVVAIDGVPSDSCFIEAGRLVGGDIITCTLTPIDGSAAGPQVVAEPVTVGNGAPSGGVATLGPDPAYETTVLNCAASGATDPDSDPITWRYEWTVGGALVPSSGAALSGTHFDKGNLIVCRAIPSDGELDGAPVSSNSLTIQNSAPQITSATLTPATGTRLDTFTCAGTGLTDVDPADTPTPQYSWFLGTLPYDAPGAAVSVDGATLAVGDSLRCAARANDGESLSATELSNAVIITNLTPSPGTPTIEPMTPTAADTLTCASVPSDPESDELTVTTRWRRNGALLTGQTDPTLAGVFVAGDTIGCDVRVADAWETSEWAPAEAVTVLDAPPTIAEVTIAQPTGGPCGEITCTAIGVADADGTTPTLTWRVEVDAVEVESTTLVEGPDNTVHLATPAPGQTVRCFATASDGASESGEVPSALHVVTNLPPSLTDVVIAPPEPVAGEVLTCSGAGYTDPDCATPPDWTFEWRIGTETGGTEILGTDSTVSTAGLTGGTVVECHLVASDGYASTSGMGSVIVLAAPLEAPTVSIDAPNGPDGPITCVADEPTADVTVNWWVGSTGPFEGSATLNDGIASDCARVRCTMTIPSGDVSNQASLVLPNGDDCDDGNPCTTHACHPAGGCQQTNLSTSCDDGEPCTVEDACVAGTCTGTPNPCDDGNPCTEAVCAPGVGCSFGFKAGPCSDGTACTVGDTCQSGSCQPGPALDCDDGDPCTADSCDPLSGCVASPASGASCDDDNPCTTTDLCDAGTCTGTPVAGKPACQDGVGFCSAGACVTNQPPSVPTVTITPPAPTTGTQLTCTPSGSVDPDGWPSPVSYSMVWRKNNDDIATGATLAGSHVVKGALITCRVTASDGQATSAPGLAQLTVANSPPQVANAVVTAVGGGSPSQGDLKCSAAGTDADPFDTLTWSATWWLNDVLVDSADLGADTTVLPASLIGGCQQVRCRATATDGSATDGSATASADSPAIDRPADACGADPCTEWTCQANACSGTQLTGSCDDGDPCTQTGTCQNGACVTSPLPPEACDTGNPCANEFCEPGTGCVSVPIDGECDDGSVCTVGDACFAGECVPGSLLDCDDNVACTSNECDPMAGCVDALDPQVVGFPVHFRTNVAPYPALDQGDDLELWQGTQGATHVEFRLRADLPSSVDWTPVRTRVVATMHAPCCDGPTIAQWQTSNHQLHVQGDGQYASTQLFSVLNVPYQQVVDDPVCLKVTLEAYNQAQTQIFLTTVGRVGPVLRNDL